MTFRKKSKILGLLGIVAVVFTPTTASAFTWSLTATVADKAAKAVGLTNDIVSLSDLVGWDDLSDDHPLYSANGVSPTISVDGTTDRTFALFVDQPLKLDEFVDDVPVQISGVVSVPVEGNGSEFDAKVWSFTLTFTYDHDTIDLFPPTVENTLDISGNIVHLAALHTELGEEKEGGAALDVDATVTKTATTTSTVAQVTDLGELDLQPHRNGPHPDRMTNNRLEFSCCTNTNTGFGNVTKWEYKLNAFHDENGKSPPDPTDPPDPEDPEDPPPPDPEDPKEVPEPLTILGSVAALGFGAYAERKRKLSNSSEEDNTKDS